MKSGKRYCKTLLLEADPSLIAEYKKIHAKGNVWNEIIEGIKTVGITDMEIYLHDSTLFMIMETVEDFDHDAAMKILGELPRQKEWEAFVSQFQKTNPEASAKEKWMLMERVFKLEPKLDESAENGYLI